MRAARVHEFGQGLRIDHTPEPEPSQGEVLLEVHRAAVNPIDVWVTEGTVAGGSQTLPFIPGVEAVGRVDGRDVLVWGAGVGIVRDGLYRERAAVPAKAVVDLPHGMDLDRAAGLAVTGTTAWALIREVTRVTADDRVLILGASGGVGTMAVQLARRTGATVWGQTTNPAKVPFIEGLGADRVVVGSADDLLAAVAELEPTVALDPLGDGFTAACVTALQPFGRIALYGVSAGQRAELDLRMLYRKAIQLHGYSSTIQSEQQNHRTLIEAVAAAARGEFRVVVADTLPLTQAVEAHRRIKDRQVQGKLLLEP